MDPIVKTATVTCSTEHAFNVFVNRIAKWWPLESHSISSADGKPALDVIIEPRLGGAIYETKWDGSRAGWGEVLVYEPGRRIAFTFHATSSAIRRPTRVEVVFEEVGTSTQVTLTHSGWEVWADEAANKRDNYNSGWDTVFGQCYREACA